MSTASRARVSAVDGFAPPCVERVEKTDQEGAGGTESGAGGDIGDADDFEGRRRAVGADGLAYQGVADLVAGIGMFGFRILKEISGQKAAIDGDVDVFIDGRGNDKASPVLLVIGREVSATAANGDTQGCAGHNQRHTTCVSRCGGGAVDLAKDRTRRTRGEAATTYSVSRIPAREPIS